MRWLICLVKGRHDPRRASAMGGFKCSVCERVEADLDGFDPDLQTGYINPLAKKYNRIDGSIERAKRW